VFEPSGTTATPSETEVLATVAEFLTELVGEDGFEDEITMETSFTDDLELESIMFVALTEQLIDRYGDRIDFVNWIASKELDEIIDLRVGELVEYITTCLAS
jgi:acyl carrier protein